MIQKEPTSRKDRKSSAKDSLRYGEGIAVDRETGEIIEKSLRTRLGGFGLVENGVYQNFPREEMLQIIDLAAAEMQANCDLNTRVGSDNKIMHRIFSWDQHQPNEAVLRDTEDSALAALKLDNNHFASFLHNDNGHWHLHLFASRIDKVKHSGNSLWMSHQKLDKVCREVELRHGLKRDEGMHDVDEHGNIIAIPFSELRERRLEKQKNQSNNISDKAQAIEIYSGEKSFQTWANEIRIGDRLKHAKSWQELHATASTYGLAIKTKGAGFTLSPIGQKGGMQLSKLGLKNLVSRLGVFEEANLSSNLPVAITQYQPEPSKPANSLYEKFKAEKANHRLVKTSTINAFNDQIKAIRNDLKLGQKEELDLIKSKTKSANRYASISLAKMNHVVIMANLIEAQREERSALYQQLSRESPGRTFREFVVKQAEAGNDEALILAQKYATEKSTKTLVDREESSLLTVAKVYGNTYMPSPRLPIKHRVTWLGSVVYDLGHGHTITDKISPNRILLNNLAANDPTSIETSLRFAAKKFGGTLTLTGTREFQRLAVETSVNKGLGIKFADPDLDKYRITLIEQQKEQQNARTIRNENRNIPPAHRRDRLRQLSELNVAGNESLENVAPQQPAVLLPENVRDHVGRKGNDADHSMRWYGNGGRGNESTSQPTYDIETRTELYANRVDIDTSEKNDAAQLVPHAESIHDAFNNSALGALTRESCRSAKILAIKDESVVVSLGRGNKAIIHNVANAQHFTQGQIITIINKEAKLDRQIEKDDISR